MLLAYIIVAISVSFAPLAVGRPSVLPAMNSNHPSTAAEPGTLLGRRYQDLRDTPRVVRGYNTPSGYHTYQKYQQPSRPKPFAQYLAERSEDPWPSAHERPVDKPERRGIDGAAAEPNYVSHVGPFAFIEPPPSPPAVEAAKPAAPMSGVPGIEPSAPVSPAAAAPVNSTKPVLSSSSVNSTSTAHPAKKAKVTKIKAKTQKQKQRQKQAGNS